MYIPFDSNKSIINYVTCLYENTKLHPYQYIKHQVLFFFMIYIQTLKIFAFSKIISTSFFIFEDFHIFKFFHRIQLSFKKSEYRIEYRPLEIIYFEISCRHINNLLYFYFVLYITFKMQFYSFKSFHRLLQVHLKKDDTFSFWKCKIKEKKISHFLSRRIFLFRLFFFFYRFNSWVYNIDIKFKWWIWIVHSKYKGI